MPTRNPNRPVFRASMNRKQGVTRGSDVAGLRLSVVIPCRNERSTICACVESALCNGYPGDLEVIVVDAMSDDGTRDVLRELATRYGSLKVLDNPSKITPVGLNIGIKASEGDVILILGAHCVLAPRYIETVTLRLLSESNAGCVGGRTTPTTSAHALHEAIGAVLSSPFGVGNAYYRIPGRALSEVDTVAYGVYRRDLFNTVGCFDERLVRNQDLEFNWRLRKSGWRVILDPSVQVYYTPRRSIGAFSRQAFGNGLWSVLVWKLAPGSLSWRHCVPLLFVAFIALVTLVSLVSFLARAALCLVTGLYLVVDALESARIVVRHRKPSLSIVFLVFPILHVSYGVGSLCAFLSIPFRLVIRPRSHLAARES